MNWLPAPVDLQAFVSPNEIFAYDVLHLSSLNV